MNERPTIGSLEVKRLIAALFLIGVGVGVIRLAIEMRALLLVLGGLALALVGAVLGLTAIGRYVLGPLDKAARGLMRPTQFTIADFLSLVFLLQVPTAFIHATISRAQQTTLRWLDCSAWIACSLMWALSVRTLSRAGIVKPAHRLVFLALVLPVAYFGAMAFVAVGTMVCAALVSRDLRQELDIRVVRLLLAAAILPVAFELAARFVRRMVAASEATAAPPGQSDGAPAERVIPTPPSPTQSVSVPG